MFAETQNIKLLKKEVFDKGMEILNKDLNDRFPDSETLKLFLMEVNIYKDI